MLLLKLDKKSSTRSPTFCSFPTETFLAQQNIQNKKSKEKTNFYFQFSYWLGGLKEAFHHPTVFYLKKGNYTYLPHRKLNTGKRKALQRKKHKCWVLLLQRKLKKPGYFKQEVYLNNKTLYLKGKLSRIFFSSFLFFRVIYPYLDRDRSTCNSYVQKSYKIVLGFTMIKEKTLKLSNQTKYARLVFFSFLFLNSESKITYWNIKIKGEGACH